MTDWIRFEDREPAGWFVAADCEDVSECPFRGDEVSVARDKCGYTHWRPFEAPHDLPPRLGAIEPALADTLRERIEEARDERDAAADDGDYEAALRWRTRAEVYEEILGEVER